MPISPLREIADNWNVDISADLDEYIQELDEATASQIPENVNFAQAALMIQGSTVVYGKKVESLYELVFAALDMTAEATGTEAIKPAAMRKKQDEDPTLSYQDDFLPLDDVLPVSDEQAITLTAPRESSAGLLPQAPPSLSSGMAMTSWLHESSGSATRLEPLSASADQDDDDDGALLDQPSFDQHDLVLGDEPPPPPPPAPRPDEDGAWALIDPDFCHRGCDKPFRRGKTYTVPTPEDDGLEADMCKLREVLDEESLVLGLAKVKLGAVLFAEFAKRALPLHPLHKDEAQDALGDNNEDDAPDESHLDTQDLVLGDEDMSTVELAREHVEQAPESYSDLVRQHVAHFLEQARNWAQESKLTQRVRAWENHIEPILREQEARPAFDIVATELQVLQRCKVDEQTPFGALLAKNSTRWEVSRRFLATLQLANQGNVRLVHSERVPDEVHFSGTDLQVLCVSMDLMSLQAKPRKKTKA